MPSQDLKTEGSIHVRQVARHNQSIVSHERLPSRSYPLFAILRERKLSRTCVAPVEAPLCLAMSHYENSWGGHGRGMVWSCRRECEGSERVNCVGTEYRLAIGVRKAELCVEMNSKGDKPEVQVVLLHGGVVVVEV